MIKRSFDIVIAGFGLLFLMPLLALISLLVRYKIGSPVLFIQARPGLNSRSFLLVKFRTMMNISERNGVDLTDAQRLTSFGGFLRSTSLDELPELWNVLKGDMSLVGPRPLLIKYLTRYSPEQKRRHEVRPGVTGWAQVNGRNAISWEDKFRLDVWYVDNMSFWLDIKILFLTFLRVFQRKGVSAIGEATMPEFIDQNEQ